VSALRAGKVALVTGASSGIGRECAIALARRGVRVIAVARREGRLRALRDELQLLAPGSDYLAGDLGEREFAEYAIDRTLETQGGLDLLIHNAAMPKHKQIYDLDAEEVERVLRVNYLSVVWTTLRGLPAMLSAGSGCIVNVSSFAARVVPPREAAYAASKAALSAWSEGLQHDLAGSGVHVGLVHPGPIDTEIWQKTDEASAYRGPRFPARAVVDAIFRVVEGRRFEITVPRRNPSLIAARALGLLAPGLLRRAMARMDPVPEEVIERARARARGTR